MRNSTDKISVVVTGKLWETDRFVRSLDQMRSDDRVQEIIFSTWEDEAATHQVMLNKFSQQYDLKIAAVPEPAKWSGNLLAQMVALYVGLGQVPDSHYVLKTRTDVFIKPDALDHVFRIDRSVQAPTIFQNSPRSFDEKVSVWGIEATSPFYIHDLFFFGGKRDILKLVNMDMRYDLLYRMSKEKIHIRRFLHPFLHDFPILEKFLHVENALGITEEYPPEYRYAVLQHLLKSDLYVTVLAIYYQLVCTYYSDDWGAGDIFEWRDVPDQPHFQSDATLTDFFLGNQNLKALMPPGDEFYHWVVNQDYAPCEVGERFTKAFNYLSGLDDIRSACLEFDFDKFLQETIDAGKAALDQLRDDLKQD